MKVSDLLEFLQSFPTDQLDQKVIISGTEGYPVPDSINNYSEIRVGVVSAQTSVEWFGHPGFGLVISPFNPGNDEAVSDQFSAMNVGNAYLPIETPADLKDLEVLP